MFRRLSPSHCVSGALGPKRAIAVIRHLHRKPGNSYCLLSLVCVVRQMYKNRIDGGTGKPALRGPAFFFHQASDIILQHHVTSLRS